MRNCISLAIVFVLCLVAHSSPVRSNLGADGIRDLKGGTDAAFVEYLESTGTQWIDTGIPVSSALCVEVEALAFSLPKGLGWCPIGGCDRFGVNGMYTYIADNRGAYGNYGATERSVGLITFNQWFTLKMNQNIYYIDSASRFFSALSFSSPVTYTLFARNNATGVYQLGNGGRIRWATISDGNGNLLRDLVPVRIGREGYMLDQESGTLFANQGTGAFVIGPDIEPLEL